MTSTRVHIFQDEDLFDEVRLGPQQTYKRTTEKPRLRLNRVKMAAKNKEAKKKSALNAKKPKSQNSNILADDADPVEIIVLDGILDRKDETEEDFTKFV